MSFVCFVKSEAKLLDEWHKHSFVDESVHFVLNFLCFSQPATAGKGTDMLSRGVLSALS